MVLGHKPHIKRMYGVWYVFLDYDWKYKLGSPPYESLAHAIRFVDNYHKGIHQRGRMIPQPLIDAAEALHEPKQTTWSPLLPFKQVIQQVSGIWIRFS